MSSRRICDVTLLAFWPVRARPRGQEHRDRRSAGTRWQVPSRENVSQPAAVPPIMGGGRLLNGPALQYVAIAIRRGSRPHVRVISHAHGRNGRCMFGLNRLVSGCTRGVGWVQLDVMCAISTGRVIDPLLHSGVTRCASDKEGSGHLFPKSLRSRSLIAASASLALELASSWSTNLGRVYTAGERVCWAVWQGVSALCAQRRPRGHGRGRFSALGQKGDRGIRLGQPTTCLPST